MQPRDRVEPEHLPQVAPPPERSREVDLVRLRLLLVLGSTSIMSLLAGGLIVALVVPGFGSYASEVVDRAPRPILLGFVAAFSTAIWLLAWMVREVVRPAEELAASRRQWSGLYETARGHALEDSLTGLGNHRAFHDEFERRLAWAASMNVPMALVLLDLDDFKAVNDSAGHGAGDALLVRLAGVLAGGLRGEDGIYRIGGDEFAILMPGADAPEAAMVTSRLLDAARSTTTDGAVPAVGFSAGVAASPADGSVAHGPARGRRRCALPGEGPRTRDRPAPPPDRSSRCPSSS